MCMYCGATSGVGQTIHEIATPTNFSPTSHDIGAYDFVVK